MYLFKAFCQNGYFRLFRIGGPNKKWSTTAYDYIAREHPDLWMIEANSTYFGWFVGGNQTGDLDNTVFVDKHIRGHGALGNFFADGISFKSQTRSSMKMGDTPSLVCLLDKKPEDPSKDSWGGRCVRAWDRPRITFERPPTVTDKFENYSIIDIVYKLLEPAPVGTKASLLVDNQEFTGYPDENGGWHFPFSPKETKQWSYTVKSNDPGLNGQTAGFTSTLPLPNQPASPRYPQWWTDDPDPALIEGKQQGAKTISRWREDFLKDFAARMLRCKNRPPKTNFLISY